MSPISLTHFLVVSAILFAIGCTLVIVRRNAVLVLMGIELILNAAAINFIAFSRFSKVQGFYPGRGNPFPTPPAEGSPVEGDAAVVFVIVVAAAEAAVALAIILNLFHGSDTIDVDDADELRE